MRTFEDSGTKENLLNMLNARVAMKVITDYQINGANVMIDLSPVISFLLNANNLSTK